MSEKPEEAMEISDSIILDTIMSKATDAIFFKDRNGRYIYVNQQMAKENAITDTHDMIGKTNYDYFAKEVADQIDAHEKQIMATGESIDGAVNKYTRLNGQTEWRSFSKSPIYDKNGQIVGVWGISRNITEAETAKAAVQFSETKFRLMIENISDVIEILDEQGKVLYVSPNQQNEFGWMAEETIGQSVFVHVHPNDRKTAQGLLMRILGNPQTAVSEELRVKCKDGRYKHIDLSGKNLADNPYIKGILIKYHDISGRKKQEEKISYLSLHDSMTGLYNRLFLETEKRRLDTDRQIPISMIMGDVNGLKSTNDTYGHAEGDRLLIATAKILAQSCRCDDIIARIGGDEFCILLPRTDLSGAEAICNRIEKACQEYKSEPNKREFHPSIALGFAAKTNPNQTLDRILKEAEDMMYRRKALAHELIRESANILPIEAQKEENEQREDYTDRMVRLTIQLGTAMGLNDEQLLELDLLSRLHDIGKVSIDDKILAKPGKLTEEEWIKVKQHPAAGFRIAQASIELVRISRLILSHHERWDGTGYPQGLAGREIPLLSRVIAVIDAFDAMTRDKPYRKAITKEAAINEIIENADKQFDPMIAEIFVTRVLGEPWK
jgi:diguanylate cyclase (GGDEF)-like protein/PAS domain S-box-containing protein